MKLLNLKIMNFIFITKVKLNLDGSLILKFSGDWLECASFRINSITILS